MPAYIQSKPYIYVCACAFVKVLACVGVFHYVYDLYSSDEFLS